MRKRPNKRYLLLEVLPGGAGGTRILGSLWSVARRPALEARGNPRHGVSCGALERPALEDLLKMRLQWWEGWLTVGIHSRHTTGSDVGLSVLPRSSERRDGLHCLLCTCSCQGARDIQRGEHANMKESWFCCNSESMTAKRCSHCGARYLNIAHRGLLEQVGVGLQALLRWALDHKALQEGMMTFEGLHTLHICTTSALHVNMRGAYPWRQPCRARPSPGLSPKKARRQAKRKGNRWARGWCGTVLVWWICQAKDRGTAGQGSLVQHQRP